MQHDQSNSLCVYFANHADKISLKDIATHRFSLSLQELVQDFGFDRFVVLDQMHSTTGLIVQEPNITAASWFAHQGDFLITQQRNVALVVLTADCVPLIFHDRKTQAVALIHAGWKGSYAGILDHALDAMQNKFGSKMQDISAFFGPSARLCCYQVSQTFKNDFVHKYPESSSAFVKKEDGWYFDNNLFLQEAVKKFGIKDQNIYTNNALCTICNVTFCSFRREKEHADRQVTLVALR